MFWKTVIFGNICQMVPSGNLGTNSKLVMPGNVVKTSKQIWKTNPK